MDNQTDSDHFSFVDAETKKPATICVSEVAQLVENRAENGTCTVMMNDGRTFYLLLQDDGFRLSLIHPFDH